LLSSFDYPDSGETARAGEIAQRCRMGWGRSGCFFKDSPARELARGYEGGRHLRTLRRPHFLLLPYSIPAITKVRFPKMYR
jgi:hypothetical protein